MSASITRRKAWSAGELATAYGFSLAFVRKQIALGALPAKKIGRRVIVLDTDLQAFLLHHSLGVSSTHTSLARSLAASADTPRQSDISDDVGDPE